MGKKVFRHSPHRGKEAIRILAGTKTNATIRDLEETLEDIEEKEGTVISIDKDKITGDGWLVKDTDGETYNCNIASNMYQLPETEEYGGMYYPTGEVSVKFTINPVLRTATITEVTSLGEDEENIDLSQWKHEDKATTIIAKPKSAISISNAVISFNYNNTNEVLVDEDEVKTEGEKTNINSNVLDINSDNVNIRDKSLEEYLAMQNAKQLGDEVNNQFRDSGISIFKQSDLGQLNINRPIYIPGTFEKEKIITDLKDPSLYPEGRQCHPLLSGNGIDKLFIYPNGIVTVQATTKSGHDRKILSTNTWGTSQYSEKNVIVVLVRQMCKCCNEYIDGKQTYFNYCPHCKTWNTLYDNDNHITCNTCNNKWCQGCGHLLSNECSNQSLDLKKYGSFNIPVISTSCDYCKNDIPSGKLREYANYCPKCHQWGYLEPVSEYVNGEERRLLHCTNSNCNEYYCTNCTISQSRGFIHSFFNEQYKNYTKDKFNKEYYKITHIRDD